MVTCYDAHKGDKLWEEDLNDFKCKSSPSLVGKQLYVFGEAGKCWILEPTRAGVKRVRQTDLGEELRHLPGLPGRPHVRPREEEPVLHWKREAMKPGIAGHDEPNRRDQLPGQCPSDGPLSEPIAEILMPCRDSAAGLWRRRRPRRTTAGSGACNA